MQESATGRASTGPVAIHPLDPGDAAITAAMRAMVSSAKGARPGIEARGQFDALMESVLPRDDVTFEADTLGGVPGLWARGALHGKVGGAFTSSATQHGGQETTLFSIITNLLHFGMVVVGLDYGHAGQMTLDEITGGSPYGATTITGGDGSRMPTMNELVGARYQGRKIAEVANKLHG